MVTRTSQSGLRVISTRSLGVSLAAAALLLIGGAAGAVVSALPHQTSTSGQALPAAAPADHLEHGGPR